MSFEAGPVRMIGIGFVLIAAGEVFLLVAVGVFKRVYVAVKSAQEFTHNYQPQVRLATPSLTESDAKLSRELEAETVGVLRGRGRG